MKGFWLGDYFPAPAINPPEAQAVDFRDTLDTMAPADRRQTVRDALSKVATGELVDVMIENIEFEDLCDLFENELEQEIG